VKKSFFYYLLPPVSRGLVGFFLIPFTTYYLDPIDFGIASILTVISGLIVPLSSTGSTWVLTAHFYNVEGHQKKVLVFNLLFLDILLRFFWCIVFFATAAFYLPMIVSGYTPEYLSYYQLVLLGVLFSGTWNTVSYTLVLQTRARTHAALEVGQHLTNVIAIIVCLKYIGLGVVALFLAPLAAGTYAFLVGFWALRHNIAIRLSMSWLKEIFTIGMPSIPFNLFEIITNTIDRFFIQGWSNLANLGIYSHSKSYQYMFSLSKNAFLRSFAPEVLDTYANMKDIERVRQILTLWYGLLGLCGTFVVLFSREIISVLTHGKLVAAAGSCSQYHKLSGSHILSTCFSEERLPL
jgi:O-antigen/teichoic acid export membrane protein